MSLDLKRLLAAGLLALTVAACGGDGDNDDNDNDLGGDPGDDPSVQPTLTIADDPADLTGRGQWGGLVLSGFGINNNGSGGAGTELESEAVATGTQRFFGGDDNTDSSGSVSHLIIAESGVGFRANEEVQGLTIEAAGSGTSLDHIQVLGSEDDGIEWFGGAASLKYGVINGPEDDGLDYDEGIDAVIQNVLVIQGATVGDHGSEADNAGPGDDATPVSRPVLANITILGNTGSDDTSGLLWRRGFGGQLWRSVISDDTVNGGAFDDGCFDIDDQVDENLAFVDVIVNCINGVQAEADRVDDGDTFQADLVAGDNEIGAGEVTFFDVDNADPQIDPDTLAVTNAAVNVPDNAGGTATLPDGVDNEAYVGAVNPDATVTPFWQGWTYVNSAVDGGLPGADFHPLQQEIEDGTIAPAGANACTTVNPDFTPAADVTIFGQTFPVCQISQRITTDTTLVNSHVFVLTSTVNVGDGDAEGGPSGNNNATLSIPAGTQIYGARGTQSALVITRGSQIQASGTNAQPIIMGAVQVNFQ